MGRPEDLPQDVSKILEFIVESIRDGTLPKEFEIFWGFGDDAAFRRAGPGENYFKFDGTNVRQIHIAALTDAGLLFARPTVHGGHTILHRCWVTNPGYEWVDGYAHQTPKMQAEYPVEITDSLKRFRSEHPNYKRSCFLIMRFATTELHSRIVSSISEAFAPHGIEALRADGKAYHSDLYTNVLTYVYGCSFGIAIFERIERDDFNPNVSLEVGLMFGLRKPVCLLKDKTLHALHSDLVGKLYQLFDTIKPEEGIRVHLTKWLSDNEII